MKQLVKQLPFVRSKKIRLSARVILACTICIVLIFLHTERHKVSTDSSDTVATGVALDRTQFTHRLMVRLRGKISDDEVRLSLLSELAETAGIELDWLRKMSGGGQVLTMPVSMTLPQAYKITTRLQRHPQVELAEPDLWVKPVLVPNDSQYFQQWHLFEDAGGSRVQTAWDTTTGDASIVIAVIDTGVLLDHPDLVGRTMPGFDFVSLVAFANDGDGNDTDPSDPGNYSDGSLCAVANSTWHGTHVAGIIGAVTDNNIGVAGINWQSKILPVRVSGACGGFTADMVDGLRWAAGLSVSGSTINSSPANIINISLTSPGVCPNFVQSAIDDAVNVGALVVAGAGNNAADVAGFHPANCNNVLSVAATTRSGAKAVYSNSGSLIGISAPGGKNDNQILSTKNIGTSIPVTHSYGNLFGSSMSAAHVSGVASLVWSADISQTAEQVRNHLLATARVFPDSSCNTSICGAGIIDATAAVLSAAGKPNTAPLARNGDLITDEGLISSGSLLASDDDGDALIYSIVSNGIKGTVVISNTTTGAYTYTPNLGATGSDSFTFKASDGLLDSNVATVSITINIVNVEPVANSGNLVTDESVASSGNLSASDDDGDALIYSIVSNGTKGAVVITDTATGAYTYTPNLGATGNDSFTFKASDGLLDSNVATVSITINNVKVAPATSTSSLNLFFLILLSCSYILVRRMHIRCMLLWLF